MSFLNKTEKNCNKKFNKKFIAVFLTLTIVVLGISGILLRKNGTEIFDKTTNLIFKLGNNKELNGGISQENLEIGQACYVSSADITLRETGTGPFDDNNDPGNDEGADNNIVRSFDKITWTIENTLSLKNLESDVNYSGGVLIVSAEFPQELVGKVRWDMSSMAWAENAQIVDGRILTAEYSLSTEQITIPGKQNVEFVMEVLGAPNELEISPTFTTKLAGNEESETVTVVDNDTVYVSAKPSLNINLGKNARLNYKSNFDLETGTSSTTANENTIYGRIQGYSLAIQLYNQDTSKKLKGIEIPKGDITFDIEFNEQVGTVGNLTTMTETEGYTPILWDYNKNTKNEETGILGRNLKWNQSIYTIYGYNTAPFNNIEYGQYQVTSCYNGGDWTITQDEIKPYIYHVTVKNYELNPDFIFPAKVADSSVTYTDNIGCISAGYLEEILQIPSNYENNSIFMDAKVSNLEFTSISDTVSTTDANSSDNRINTSITISTNAVYSKLLLFGSSSYSALNRYADGYYCRDYKNGKLYARIYVQTNTDEQDWLYGADELVKFDDRAIELKYNNDGTEYTPTNNGTSNDSDGIQFNILYAGKPDKQGWASEEEMNNTSMDELVYFDTLEEINEAGYVCVAFLAESISGHLQSGIEMVVNVPFNVKGTTVIGNVYQALLDVRAYTQDNIPDRTTQTHLLTNDINDYPEMKWVEEEEPYIKTQYDEDANIVPGTHTPGSSVGASFLAIGGVLSLSMDDLDGEGDTITYYNIGRNENTVDLTVQPSIFTYAQSPIENITLKIEAYIPDGLSYIPGSCDIGEPEITRDEENQLTTLVWYITGCAIRTDIEPFHYLLHISEETEHGHQYDIRGQISEYVAEGDVPKLGNTIISRTRRSLTSIQITNLTSYALYKNTETPVIDINDNAEFHMNAINKTVYDLDTFQLFDVLPYNGDSRGTDYHGNYIVKKINITNLDNSGTEITNNNLKLYITDSEDVRTNVTVNDEDLGTTDIWNEITPGSDINSEITAIALKGKLPANATINIQIQIETDGNEPYDTYQNQAQAQINPSTEPIQSSIVKIEVVSRQLDGKVWLDENRNGVIDDGESFMQDVTLQLLNEDGTAAIDIYNNEIPATTTNEDGYYKFVNMKQGNYYVKIIHDAKYELTEKGVGSNFEINSKFNDDDTTDLITKFNSLETPLLKQEFVNAGLVRVGGAVIVNHYIEGTTTPITLSNGETAEQEMKFGELDEEYETSAADCADYYELVAVPDNATGTYGLEDIYVTYYYRLKSYPYTVNYYDKETGEKIATSKQVEGLAYGDKIYSNSEIIEINKYTYDSANKEYITISSNASLNVINLYYIKKTGSVITKYIDIDSGNEISSQNKTTGKIDDDYTTEQKEIKGYVYVKDTNNTYGKYIDGNIDVTYYYRKQFFNLKIKKNIDNITINNKSQSSNDKIFKIELKESKLDEYDVRITYSIKITNTGEIPGYAKEIKESIPEGLEFNQSDNDIKWVKNNNSLITTDLSNIKINPGESEEIFITFRWKNEQSDLGTIKNKVELTKTQNEFGYEETSIEDNKSDATFVISISTGLDSIEKNFISQIFILVLILLTILILSNVIYKLKNKRE